MDIIKALKENEKPFGLMPEEMQAKAREMSADLQKFCTNGWVALQAPSAPKMKFATYRLRPDYEESEVVECEVKLYKGRLWWFNADGDPVLTINNAIDYPDFIGFKYEGGTVSGSCRLRKDIYGMKFVATHHVDPADYGYEVLTPTHVLFRRPK